MTKIDYVVISSNDDPMYKDFYTLVSKRWNELGIKNINFEIKFRNSNLMRCDKITGP
jgi:hypothetical protein